MFEKPTIVRRENCVTILLPAANACVLKTYLIANGFPCTLSNGEVNLQTTDDDVAISLAELELPNPVDLIKLRLALRQHP